MKLFGINLFEPRATTPPSTVADPMPWLVEALRGGWHSHRAGVNVTPHSVTALSAVFACTRVLAEDIATLPLYLYRRGKGNEHARATEHPLFNLLSVSPNIEMPAFSFFHLSVWDQVLWGNSYAEIERDGYGSVTALWPIPALFVLPFRAPDNTIAYRVSIPGSAMVTLRREDVLHVPALVTDNIVGKAPWQLAPDVFGLSTAVETFASAYYANGGHLKDILEYPGKLSDAAKKNLKDSWSSEHGSLDKAQRVALLEEGLKYTAVQSNLKDILPIEQRQHQTLEIARLYRMPPHKIGVPERTSGASAEISGQDYLQGTLRPWLVRWQQYCAFKLLKPSEKAQYYFEFYDADLVKAPLKDRYEAHAIARQNGWLSVNDIRRIEDMDPIPNGDQYLTPLNMVPLGTPQDSTADPNPPEPGSLRRKASDPVEQRAAIAPPDGTDARRALCRSFEPVFSDVLTRVQARQRADVMRQAGKSSATDAAGLTAWVNDYFDSEHPAYVARCAKPTLTTYARALYGTFPDAEDILPDAVTGMIDDLCDGLATRTCLHARKALQGAFTNNLPLADTCSTHFTTQAADGVADKAARSEAAQCGNALALASMRACGITSKRWATGADECGLCQSMNGKTLPLDEPFTVAGVPVTPDTDGQTPLTPTNDLLHPPLHAGCRCQLAAGGK